MDDKRLQIILEAVDETKQSFKSVTDSLKKLQETAKQTEEANKQTNSLADGFKNLAKAAGGLAVLATVTSFLKSSVAEAATAQEVNTRLAQTLYTATGASEAQVQALYDQADALELVTTVSGDAITAGQAKLATFDLQAESIKRLTPAMLDFAVGENGAAVSGEQLASISNGLGKALQGQVDVLTKGGFKFTEAQLHLLKTGDETERVTALTEILNSTYAGAAEAAGQTFTGQLMILQNRIGKVKEAIGMALMPALQSLISQVFQFGDGVTINQDKINQWGKAIYQGVNYLIAMAKAIQVPIIGLKFFAQALWEFAKISAETWKGINQAMSGDFSDAYDTLGGVVDKGFSGVMEAVDRNGAQLSTAMAGIGQSALRAIDAEGFKPIAQSVAKVNTSFEKAADDGKEMSKEMKKALEDLAKTYKDFNSGVGDELFDLDQKHNETFTNLSADLDKVRENMAELRKDYAKTTAAASADLSGSQAKNTKDLAQSVIDNEERMAEIQKELAGSVAATKRTELIKELEERKKSVSDNAELLKSIDAAVVEARRVAGLSDLARQIEEYRAKQAAAQADYDAKVALATQEFNDKMAREKKEMEALNLKVTNEQKLYDQKRKFIEDTQNQIIAHHKMMTEQNLLTTKEGIDKEIEMYKALAKAIQSARSGNQAEFNRAVSQSKSINDGVISPSGNIISTSPADYLIATKKPGALVNDIMTAGSGSTVTKPTQSITINFSGATFMGKEGVAREIGKQIVEELKLNQRFA